MAQNSAIFRTVSGCFMKLRISPGSLSTIGCGVPVGTRASANDYAAAQVVADPLSAAWP